jgi:hypothetical protein
MLMTPHEAALHQASHLCAVDAIPANADTDVRMNKNRRDRIGRPVIAVLPGAHA